MTPQEASCHAEQNGDNSLELLRRFLETHHLSLEQLAGLFGISPPTVEEWFSEGMAPPAAFLALAVLFDAGKIMSGRERHEPWPYVAKACIRC
jgi:AraC-like DNA-binding protein